MSEKLYVVAEQAILPGQSTPKAATIEVDLATRKFTSIREGIHSSDDAANTIRLEPEQVLLPGLIE